MYYAKHNNLTIAITYLLAFLLPAGFAGAIIDPENKGQWNKPTNHGPDKNVPGFLVNLGPTGARAILKEKSFVVKYVFPGSPAHKKLEIDDKITGVNDKAFETKHVFGKMHGMKYKFGYEGPIMDFGNAIEESEGADGKLKIDVVRKGKKKTVEVQLEKIGRFSDTYPLDCPKSKKLVDAAMKYILKHGDEIEGQCSTKATVGMALLSQDKIKQAKTLVADWYKPPGKNMWTWHLSYQCILLCECYLATGNKNLLKPIKLLVKRLYDAQVRDPSPYKNHVHNGKPHGDRFIKGGLGHKAKIDGYGVMSITTLLGLLAWEMAEECGVKVNREYVDLAYECVHNSTNKSGYIGYCFNTGAYSPVARQGISIIIHRLSPEKEPQNYISRVTSNLAKSKTRLNDGHGDNVLGVFWGLLGIQLSGDRKAIREMFDYNKAFINMARTHDGSFVAQPGRNFGDKGYYMSSRMHPTAAMVIILGMSDPKLRIQGKKQD